MIDRKLFVARMRSGIAREVRAFLTGLGYLEVETPILASEILPEATIASFRTRFESPFHAATDLYLLPSPELWMKQLLAAGSGSIFQLSRCFRNAEQIGRIHNPEFTMLEWYTVGGDYFSEIAVAERLFEALLTLTEPSPAQTAPRGSPFAGTAAHRTPEWRRGSSSEDDARASRSTAASTGDDPFGDLRPPFRRMSMEEAFERYAGVALAGCEGVAAMAAEARRVGVLRDVDGERSEAAPESWESLFNRIFVQLVEPALPQDRPLVLYDFPANVPSLARRKPGTPWCERWELYARGCELANCYSEEDDPERVAAFMREEAATIASRGETVAASAGFAECFGAGFPRSSGVALGFDRLAMLLAGEGSLEGVIFFPFADIIRAHSGNTR